MGAIAGLVMGLVAFLISAVALQLPWYAPGPVFATIVMGRNALANILQFEAVPFFVGLVVVLVITALLGALFAWILRTRGRARVIIAGLLYGLAVWALLQYVLLPFLFPLVTEKGFPPVWYAVSFGLYGLLLGLFFALWRDAPAPPEPNPPRM